MSHLNWKICAVLALALTGCQRAKMTGVNSGPSATVASTPNPAPVYNPPVYNPPVNVQPVVPVIPSRPVTTVIPVQPTLPVSSGTVITVTPVVHPVAPIPGECSCEVKKPAPSRVECRAQGLGIKTEDQLDILFVLDTSASMRGGTNRGTGGELGQLARDMHYFMGALDPNIDARIGVMLGHGRGKTATHGRLYSTDDPAQNVARVKNPKRYPDLADPFVLDYQQIRKQYGAQADEYIGRVLENKVDAMPYESHGAQGEALMLSVYDALTNATLRAEMQQKGLLRKGVPLAVIMVSDEQDICFNYAAYGMKPTIPDPEETAYLHGDCAHAVNGAELTPEAVYQAMMNETGGNAIVTTIVYEHYVAPHIKYNAQGQKISQDDNEQGWGYLNLAADAKKDGRGLVIDLATVDRDNPSFWQQMQAIGQFTETARRYRSKFVCEARRADPRSADPNSVEVCITDDQGQPLALFANHQGSDTCRASQVGGLQWTSFGADMGVVLNDAQMRQFLQSQNLTSGYVHISFVPTR